MKTHKINRKEALARIEGWIAKDRVIYYDDSTQRFYAGPVSDLDDLCELMASDDEDVARDAYSHWCAGTTHGDGYETCEQAENVAIDV